MNRLQKIPMLVWEGAKSGNVDLVRRALDEGGDVNIWNSQVGCTPLIAAVSGRHMDVVRLLVKRRADVEKRDDLDRTSLNVAVANGHADMVHLLLKSGGNPDAICAGQPVLWTALDASTPEIQEHLLNFCPNLNVVVRGRTALENAIQDGRYGQVMQLLEAGANPNVKIYHRDEATTHLIQAIMLSSQHQIEICHALLEHGADPNATDEHSRGPLEYVLMTRGQKEDNLVLVENLLERGADPNWKSVRGCTAACHLKVFSSLSTYGPYLDALLKAGYKREPTCGCKNRIHLTYLIHGREEKALARLIPLLDEWDPNRRDENGFSPLSAAARIGMNGVLTSLLDHGADPALPIDRNVWPRGDPLFEAVRHGNEVGSAQLLAHGAPWRFPGLVHGFVVLYAEKAAEELLVQAGSPTRAQAVALLFMRGGTWPAGVGLFEASRASDLPLPCAIRHEKLQDYATRMHRAIALYRIVDSMAALPAEMLLPILNVALRASERAYLELLEWDARWPLF